MIKRTKKLHRFNQLFPLKLDNLRLIFYALIAANFSQAVINGIGGAGKIPKRGLA
jgi:hypothetical protein